MNTSRIDSKHTYLLSMPLGVQSEFPTSVGVDGFELHGLVGCRELVFVFSPTDPSRPPHVPSEVEVETCDEDRADDDRVEQHAEGDDESDLQGERQRERGQSAE